MKPMLQMLKEHLPGICKEGYIFVLVSFLVMMCAFWVHSTLGIFMLFITIYCTAFFRDPVRITPTVSEALISPADGKISMISLQKGPDELGMENQEMQKVSIFLSVFDVHINRVPINSTVEKLSYREGKFLNATLDKSSTDNEAQFIKLKAHNGDEIAVTQIAGLIARRIVCDLRDNMEVAAGEKFGIIRFGSRVDLYLPVSYNLNVLEGQTVVGGETVVAYKQNRKQGNAKKENKKPKKDL